MKLKNGMLLFHGSYTEVEEVRLEKCSEGKDFGLGFYISSDAIQARQFISTSLSKAKRFGDPSLTQHILTAFMAMFCPNVQSVLLSMN